MILQNRTKVQDKFSKSLLIMHCRAFYYIESIYYVNYKVIKYRSFRRFAASTSFERYFTEDYSLIPVVSRPTIGLSFSFSSCNSDGVMST